MPAGKTTSPPPAKLHLSTARLIAAVSFVFPSAVAPNSRTLKVAALNFGSGKFGGTHGSADPAPAAGSNATAQTKTRASALPVMKLSARWRALHFTRISFGDN